EAPRDARIPALLLMALAFAAVLPGLGLLVAWLAPRAAERPAGSRARSLGLVALALVLAMPLLATGTPAEVAAAGVLAAVVAQLALGGVALLLWLRWREREALAGALRAPRRVLPAAGLGLVAVFTLTQAFGVAVHRTTLSPERMAVFALSAA